MTLKPLITQSLVLCLSLQLSFAAGAEPLVPGDDFRLAPSDRDEMLQADTSRQPMGSQSLIRPPMAFAADDFVEALLFFALFAGLGAAIGWGIGKTIPVDKSAPEPTHAMSGALIGGITVPIAYLALFGAADDDFSLDDIEPFDIPETD